MVVIDTEKTKMIRLESLLKYVDTNSVLHNTMLSILDSHFNDNHVLSKFGLKRVFKVGLSLDKAESGDETK